MAKGNWQIGEKCLAPYLENGKLHEGTISSIEKDKNGKSFAVVSFLESEERKILISKLCRVKASRGPSKSLICDDGDLEKPYFPDRNLLSPAVTFKLSDNGDFIPYTINRYLRDYQREGVQFLYGHYANKRGCILGDDMGLGKTIQVISFLAAVLHKKGTREDIENNMPEFLLRTMKKESRCNPKKTFLIVAPLSVLYNWKDELDTWGYFKVSVLHGSKKDDDLSRIKQGKCEVALTTYEILRLYLDEFNSVEWSAVIVDEAHKIKNPKAQITQTLKSLKCSVRIGLTGTILQNNMKELWCVMDWAVPGLLGSRVHFKKKFSDPVEHGQRHTATKRELATGRKAMVELARKMSGWFLRRTKVLISDQLPKKEDRMVYCSLTEFQKAIYQAVLETEDVNLILQAGEPCSCNSGRKRKNCCYKVNAYGETIKSLRFSYLTILQKVANHAALLQTDNTSKQQEAHIRRVCSQVFSSFPDFVQLSKDAAFETISDPKYSGKMKVLQQLLNHFQKHRDKVLLFSFSTKLLDVLEQYCMASGLDYRRLDGNTKSEDRIRVVREFNSIQEINICLVSTMAGGLGLNFVGANVVIVFDPTWNPANDLQAIDRAYRIGQFKPVKVFRLISLGTVEEMMYLRQVYKQQLHCAVVGSENAKRYFEAVQGSKEHQGELFGIHNLFKLRTHGSCLTKDILEREGRVEAGVMTATTWLKEETPPCSSEKYEQPDCKEDGDPHSIRAQVTREETNLCDDFSGDDIQETSVKKRDRRKPCNASNLMVTKGQLSLMQCGFSELLQGEIETTKERDNNYDSPDPSSDDTLRTNVNNKQSDFHKCQSHVPVLEHGEAAWSPDGTGKQDMHSTDWLVVSDSEEEGDEESEDQSISKQSDIVMETESSSEELDDFIFPTQVPCQQPMLTKNIEKYKSTSENCEELAQEKDEFIFKEDSRKFGSHGTESNFSRGMSLEDVKNSTRKLKGASDISDESDDIEISHNSESKLRTSSFLKWKERHALNNGLGNISKSLLRAKKPNRKEKESAPQNADEFTSSEDNLPVKKIDARKQKYKSQRRRVQFDSKMLSSIQDTSAQVKSSSYAVCRTSASKTGFEHQDQNVESMDRYLDGVQEVAYIHSNQNVVGSSKAENRLSRWAVRDVFELKQFSQLPANVAVCTAKKKEEDSEGDTAENNIVKGGQEMLTNSNPHHLYVMHPITQKNKKVHRVGSTIFLLGKTPKGIRRRQFEEMVSHFNMGSMEELAEHIAKATSETRQKMLKEFYLSRHPEIELFFPAEIPAQALHNCEERELSVTHSRKRKSIVNFGRSKSRSSSAKGLLLNGTTETRSQQSCKEVEQLHNDSCLQDVCVDAKYKQSPTVATQHIERRNSQAFKDFMASGSLSSKSEIIEVLPVKSCEGQQDAEGTQLPRKRSLSQSENGERKAQTCKKKSFVDLLGDTSVLNDLFRNDGNGPTESPRRFPSGQVEKSKERPKDFWDMLNEQNEESLKKLTDIAVIEKLCERAPHAPVTEEREVCESSLWKKNENFLWKKYSPGDSDEQSTATSCNVVK
ncbi:DNA excision repair protein ERCC-6-like 2 isoform X2 [Falco rusticolus]|uniref:DNA excision repair protein ERCC-6-like 2 isoform X2 n=1 Tax=Falco rusticolus TaxID=120794 RepID=UPI0018869C82|nr:DNA excision repair protein ERCC-6-like 2 isoform X2 [Falco rusticolus]XP_055554455.1 DNA excision repair protein ERCC-6-like 2 isoform X2 [Falco cherrug]XP_055554456.1 DNA excision repair protein ERCC-6-like 2 isoform X2 [Falco cherrug]